MIQQCAVWDWALFVYWESQGWCLPARQDLGWLGVAGSVVAQQGEVQEFPRARLPGKVGLPGRSPSPPKHNVMRSEDGGWPRVD